MRGFDIEFITYFNRLRDLDWTGLDLWVFGGIVSGWNTKDIDLIIIGDSIPEGMLKQIRELGPFDLTWTTDKNCIWFPGDVPIKFKTHTVDNGIQWIKLPSVKQINRFKRGLSYGKPFQLIKKGIVQL